MVVPQLAVCVCVRVSVRERKRERERWIKRQRKTFLWETLVCVFHACFDSSVR